MKTPNVTHLLVFELRALIAHVRQAFFIIFAARIERTCSTSALGRPKSWNTLPLPRINSISSFIVGPPSIVLSVHG
ncbi:hypothetical protein MBAV_003060 [Candidatus Magnetobacterium bavaricum]|uniref:Uncharacterized protein n=1 Tax=Candidatus Magnetobacterium bavaricum TaxID=29290 RepID=A0A0F3GS25_9BACT|nr:hypothetical protein MBAV_003060 [Candidatus Magnetobacterium bavaricum]